MQQQKSPTKSKPKSSFFRIHVRPNAKETKMLMGRVRDNEFVTDPYPVLATPPTLYIPNFYKALVIKKYDANGKYNGQFEWATKESTEGVVLIDIRYVASCQSLDKKWQSENGFEPQTDEDRVGWAYPEGKIVEFNADRMPAKLKEFYEHHEGCANNPNRDPQNSVLFKIIDSEAVVNTLKQQAETELAIAQLKQRLLSDDNEDEINALSDIFGVNAKHDYLTKQGMILQRINEDFAKAQKRIVDYKTEQSNKLAKAFKSKIVEVTNEGKLANKGEDVDGLSEFDFTKQSEKEVRDFVADKMGRSWVIKNQMEEILKQL